MKHSEWQQGHQKKHHYGCHYGYPPLPHSGSAERHDGSTNPMPTLSLTKVRTMTNRSLSEDSTGLARSFSLVSLQPLTSDGKQKVVKRWQQSKAHSQATEHSLAGISRRPWKSESCSNLRALSPQPGDVSSTNAPRQKLKPPTIPKRFRRHLKESD